ncbi:MAG: PspC domain-containing protein [Actinobacteria bacterium]|nr:PspC domain-containing protein [Actinomycetota bacterium]
MTGDVSLARRPRGSGGVIAGVCAGIADRMGWGTTGVRVVFALLGIFGAGEVLYVVLWLLMPKRPATFSS